MKFKVIEDDYRKIGVYRITNVVNNKKYIGSTTMNFRHRYLQYCSGFRRKLDNQPALYRAFRKYGFENFVFEIVCICKKENVLKNEQHYIDQGVDYNICLVAGSLEGIKHSKTSKTRTVIKGNHHSSVSVDMYSLEGEILQTFDSVTEALEFINIKSKSNIIQCCLGKTFSCGGFRWAYKDKPLINRPNRKGKHKIRIYNEKENIIVESHNSVISFLKEKGFTKASQGNISRAINNKIKIHKYNIEKLWQDTSTTPNF